MNAFQSYSHNINMQKDINKSDKTREKEKNELQEICNRLSIYVKGVSV